MKIFIALDNSRQTDGGGAGETASQLSKGIEGNGWGICKLPSRHRLYPHPDTGYRKHNTTRSFSADIQDQYLNDFIDYACKAIQSNVTPDSNAGLAIVVPEQMENTEDLINYAYQVKESLVSKQEALEIGRKIGVYLYELSGTGQGVIGALAGTGLRLTGNDGQFRGKLKLGTGEDYVATVKEIIEKSYVEQVKNMNLEILKGHESVRMGEKVKVVLLDDQYTLMVYPTEIEYPKWQTSTTNMLRVF